MSTFRTTTLALVALTIISAAAALAVDRPSPGEPSWRTLTPGQTSRAYLHSYNVPAHGVALDGFSPVSYFTKGRAEPGSPDLAVEHDGLTYHLASAEQVRQFEASPERYLPAYGGWCAIGMAVEDKFPVDPRVFKIVDGRLMLFLRNQDVDALQLWNDGDETELTRKADAHWKKVIMK